eukprot:357012-Chlamydomonas_euryale.AAC.1
METGQKRKRKDGWDGRWPMGAGIWGRRQRVPIGLEDHHQGVVCLLTRRALTFSGVRGEVISEGEPPAYLKAEVEAKRTELIEALSEVHMGGGVGGGEKGDDGGRAKQGSGMPGGRVGGRVHRAD